MHQNICWQKSICREFYCTLIRGKVLLKVIICYWKLMVITHHQFRLMSTDFVTLKVVMLTWKTRNIWDSQRSSKMKNLKQYSMNFHVKCKKKKKLAKSLNVDQETISRWLKALRMTQKQGNWVPYELKTRDIKRRFCMTGVLLNHN